jgi:hypothetical protein
MPTAYYKPGFTLRTIAEPLAIERRENEEDSAISSPANHGQAIARGRPKRPSGPSAALRCRMWRTPSEIVEGAKRGLQSHRSCFLQLLWLAENGMSQNSTKKVGVRALTLPTPMGRSKTPPRPLREALQIRVGMERSGWESSYLFGRPLANGPLESNCLSLNPAQAREGNAAPTMASIEGRPSRLR